MFFKIKQPKRLQLRERVAFIHKFVLPSPNNTAKMQPYEPNQAKNVVLRKSKKTLNVLLHLFPSYLCCHAPFLYSNSLPGRIAKIKKPKKFVPDNSNQSFLNPAICQEKFCREWVQIRKYPACVVCMPILLRICLSGSAYELQTFLDKLPDSKEVTRITWHKLF